MYSKINTGYISVLSKPTLSQQEKQRLDLLKFKTLSVMDSELQLRLIRNRSASASAVLDWDLDLDILPENFYDTLVRGSGSNRFYSYEPTYPQTVYNEMSITQGSGKKSSIDKTKDDLIKLQVERNHVYKQLLNKNIDQGEIINLRQKKYLIEIICYNKYLNSENVPLRSQLYLI